MTRGITLRQRIFLTLLPLLVPLAILGVAAMWMMHQLGSRIDVILRENYQSVLAMQDLKEALERIDSSFQFLLVAQQLNERDERESLENKARTAFAANWLRFNAALAKEQANLTIHPREDEFVSRLTELAQQYRAQGDDFFRQASAGQVRHEAYYGDSQLYDSFVEIKQLADDILQLNQSTMKQASDDASRLAASSRVWLSAGFVIAVLLAALAAWQTIRTTLRPIIAVKEAAAGISAGNLDQIVPVFSHDELGQLAEAFNVMAHHLREYRRSQSAHLLRAQKTVQAAIDSFPDATLVIDSEGRVEMANPAARRLLGVAPRHAGSPAAGIWQPPEPLRMPLEQALLGQRDYLPDEFDKIILLGEAGSEHAYLPRILTIREPAGQTLGAAVVLQDVTRLRLLDQVKSNLVATASHELKTPLTSVRLAVHLLLEESVGPLNPKQTELILDARENCERLLAMVNNLLDLARLEQGSQQLEIEQASPAALLRDVADMVQARGEDKGVEISVDVPTGLPQIAVDIKRMGHALRNLAENAVTYTDRGGKVRLSAAADRDSVTLTVRDTGCGIATEYLPRIFEKFFRVPGQSRDGGTGLGLAIVREIVAAHGGTIECESEPGSGTIFRIRLSKTHSGADAPFVSGEADRSIEAAV